MGSGSTTAASPTMLATLATLPSFPSQSTKYCDAVGFNQFVGEWKEIPVSALFDGMFSGATAFQAKFACSTATDGPPSSCELKTYVNKVGLAMHAATLCTYTNVHVIVTDEIWERLDVDSSGDLDGEELSRVNRMIRYGYVFGMPWLVYAPIPMQFLSKFKVSEPLSNSSVISLVPAPNSSLPVLTMMWDSWYAYYKNRYGTVNLENTSGRSLSMSWVTHQGVRPKRGGGGRSWGQRRSCAVTLML